MGSMTTRWRATAAATVLALVLSGCATERVPTGSELAAQAEQHYVDYRTVTNEVQALIFDGPWQAEIGSFGMQPSSAGCGDDGYAFRLTRTTRVDPDDQGALRDAVRRHLIDAGFDVEDQDLGSGASQSSDVIVRKQGDFSTLMVTFIANGSVLVTASTRCYPGDRHELSRLIFGGVTLSEGYLPRVESPSDPLFFGVTPGKPAFAGTPEP